MSTQIDLEKLSEPFAAEDIEWRVARAGVGRNGIFCMVLAYVTARACQKRLDDVCGPENWRLEEPRVLTINGKSAFACGLSIRLNDEWVTKWDVAEPTNVEPAKGGWSGSVKRAAACWGVARYLYHLDETFAEITEDHPNNESRRWHYATLKQGEDKRPYWWKTPQLPGWALPKEEDHEIEIDELHGLKRAWMAKFASGITDTADLVQGFSRFVESVCGEFPHADYTCWTKDALAKCHERINATEEPNGLDPDVPFEEEYEP